MPEVDPRLLVKVAIMDAIDDLIRAKAAELPRERLAVFIEERNRVAELLGRPRFDAVELLVAGTDD
ncbi:MAG: hypothetical protein U1E17_10940 [Geminicoccaceae bacterium]